MATKLEALQKLQKYCAYQERCHQEVRNKLLQLEVYGDDLEEIIALLIQENFLNETRFSQAFVRGKYRIKKWGKNKIIQELKKRHISAYNIKKGLSEIEEDQYLQNITDMITIKNEKWASLDPFPRRQKIVHYLVSKGYELSLAWEMTKEQVPFD